jgi:sec-independent protein translocase protein TatC
VTPEASKWIDIIIKFEIGFGFAFELPLVVFYLVIFEVVPYAKLRSLWREVYVGLMVLSAFITPDASPVTMFLLFGAMIALYEISLLAARLVMGNKIKKQKEEAERQAKEDAEWEAEWAERQRQRKLEDSEDD